MINMPRADMMTVLRKLGLTTNLKLCLDAGDSTSYTSGQSWLDLSGNGTDFFLGADSGATATDPTFNGTAGNRSSSEYLSFDGGDYLLYDTTNETWMQNLHKDNAKFTFAAWVYVLSATQHRILGDMSGSASNVGMRILYNASDQLQCIISNGSGVAALAVGPSVATGDGNAWNFLAVSLDEAIGANGAILQVNEAQELFTSTYTSPSASNASFTFEIGASGDGATPVSSGVRIASVMAWEGVALDGPQLRALFQATRGKFGV